MIMKIIKLTILFHQKKQFIIMTQDIIRSYTKKANVLFIFMVLDLIR
jgi:hypothetical protein